MQKQAPSVVPGDPPGTWLPEIVLISHHPIDGGGSVFSTWYSLQGLIAVDGSIMEVTITPPLNQLIIRIMVVVVAVPVLAIVIREQGRRLRRLWFMRMKPLR